LSQYHNFNILWQTFWLHRTKDAELFDNFLKMKRSFVFPPGGSSRGHDDGDGPRPAGEERVPAGRLREVPRLGGPQSLLRLLAARGRHVVGTQGTSSPWRRDHFSRMISSFFLFLDVHYCSKVWKFKKKYPVLLF